MSKSTSRVPHTRGKKRRTLSPDVGPILEFTRGEDKGRRIPLYFTRTIIGRKVADILVRDLNVSSSHLAVDIRETGIRIVDLGSSNGTFVRGKKVQDSTLDVGEEVTLGESSFRVILNPVEASKLLARNPVYSGMGVGGMGALIEQEFLAQRQAEVERTAGSHRPPSAAGEISLEVIAGPDRGKKFTLRKDRMVIGRTGADVMVNDSDVSRKHALLERQEDQQLLIRDLASTNGTYVNDRRISNSVLARGDKIQIGQTVLVLEGNI